ncbi:Peroxide stress regulator; Ferric uptake regulation protein; Fe2+/Zn2+ uptake regulation proteins [hydrothermal vent metagenome]|uniref:Peroxide stress regulator Ferric uptake regulation protein Fe2+/Zn2+ uptake regulation proteins n=1 Tax=hydrothermal vent metagenome TaxID=652676 RepID=A0A1W1EI74_9ZZZZ
MINYQNLLKSYGLKTTFQRLSILQSIDNAGHITIDDIHKDILINHPSLSLATVYNNILKMQEIGIIVEVPISGEKSKYEIIKANHIHLICQKCSSIIDKDINKDIEEVFNKMSIENSFILSSTQNNLYGICKNCI